MTAKIKAILIDPFEKKVEAIELDDHTHDTNAYLKQLHRLTHCDCVGLVRLENDDSVWIDDEGLLKPWEQQAFFLAPFHPEPFAGHAVISRTETEYIEDGEQIDHMRDCKTDIEQLRAAIQWVAPKSVEVAAPTITSFHEGGSITESLDGRDKWTFKDNPTTGPVRAAYGYSIQDGVVCIIDSCIGKSVTNDAENVIADLACFGIDMTLPIIYRDTEGAWDQMVVKDRAFSHFASLGGERVLARAIEKVKK